MWNPARLFIRPGLLRRTLNTFRYVSFGFEILVTCQKESDGFYNVSFLFNIILLRTHKNKYTILLNAYCLFQNVTAVKTYIEMLEHQWILPKGVPFSVHQREHLFEAVTLFNVLYSAKDYDTFYKSAVYVREHINEHLFSYVLTVVIYNRKDTQGVFVPHVYETFPSFFYNGEILTTAQRINTHGQHNIEFYPTTYKWNDNVVIKWNSTIWPYAWKDSDAPVTYFTHDNELNALYYNLHVAHPSWLGGEVIPLVKDRRGEWFWFIHKQILTRYYMERLSNNLGEIPVLGQDVVQHGYNPGLLYHNGVPFPVRPSYFHLDQPDFVEAIQAIEDYEHRVRDAIDKGYVINVSLYIVISSGAEHATYRLRSNFICSKSYSLYFFFWFSLVRQLLSSLPHTINHLLILKLVLYFFYSTLVNTSVY